MKKEELKIYIEELMNETQAEEEQVEISNCILLLDVYMAGLEQKPFPIEKIGREDGLKLEEELPAQFHKLVGLLSIKKSKIEQRINDFKIIGYITRTACDLLEDFRKYFIL